MVHYCCTQLVYRLNLLREYNPDFYVRVLERKISLAPAPGRKNQGFLMSNKSVPFESSYTITISGRSRKFPEDKLTFMQENFEEMLFGLIKAYDKHYKGMKIEVDRFYKQTDEPKKEQS